MALMSAASLALASTSLSIIYVKVYLLLPAQLFLSVAPFLALYSPFGLSQRYSFSC